ncbi:MAG: hypothetical protein JSU74_02735 [Candidatus Zixiibacteriota bacterium]|nr:MAG: hypothetical protein JSU74_02735 [candidate division Zixibacteria bacterium]
MNRQLSLTVRRAGVVIHYAAVAGLTIFLYATLGQVTPLYVPVIGLVLIAIALVSYLKVHVSTRLWKLAWAKPALLDEREMQVTREAFRRSYNIVITVGILIAILAFIIENSYMSTEAFLEKRSFNAVPLMFALVHFAKTLPASILAWSARETKWER